MEVAGLAASIGKETRVTYDGSKEPDIALGELRADNEVLAVLENLLELVERLEERDDGGLIGLLRSSESGFVDAVVDLRRDD